MALTNLGKGNISSLTEGTTEARACNQYYSHTLEVMLSRYPWSFATKFQSMAGVTNPIPAGTFSAFDVISGQAKAYELPTDCLKVIDVLSSQVPEKASDLGEYGVPYKIANRVVYTTISPAILCYITKETDPTKFDTSFIEALSWELAARLAMPLVRDFKVRNDALNFARVLSAQAEMVDANETRHHYNHLSDYEKARA